MLRLFLVSAFSLIATIASAQQPQPFVPFTVSEGDVQGLRSYLGKQPWEIAQPVMLWLEAMEQKAQAEAKKKADADQPTAKALPHDLPEQTPAK